MCATSDPNRLLQDAEGHFLTGRHATARRLIEQVLRMVPGHPAVLHLYGLILSNLGEMEAARRALDTAHILLPRDPQIGNNLGNLLGKLSDRDAALAAYDDAIRADPRFAPARLNRAITLDELARHDEARVELAVLATIEAPTTPTLIAAASVERNAGDPAAAAALLDQLLAIDPVNVVGLAMRARVGLDMGDADAADRHRLALAAAPADPELLLGYVDAADIETRYDALDAVARRLVVDPMWHDGHRILSTARWEDGVRDTFAASYETATATHPRDAALWKGYVEALGRVDAFSAAADVCLRAATATGDPAFTAAAFSYRSAVGDLDGAEALFARLPAGMLSPLALAKHRLRRQDPGAAEQLLAKATAEVRGDHVEAWALRGIAWQLLGDKRFDWLNRQEGLVGIYDLPLSAIEIAGIADRLRAVHARATLRAGQSARGGTQTGGNLFHRREPEIRLLRDTLRHAVERHRVAMPPADPAHPVLRHRDAPMPFAGSWSIRLTDGGFHVQHIHPAGVLSAASYWALPAPSPADDQAGWLEIGGAPAYLALDLDPMLRIAPAIGRVVLFPSTLHHGTRPFPAGERMSVAFDVVAG